MARDDHRTYDDVGHGLDVVHPEELDGAVLLQQSLGRLGGERSSVAGDMQGVAPWLLCFRHYEWYGGWSVCERSDSRPYRAVASYQARSARRPRRNSCYCCCCWRRSWWTQHQRLLLRRPQLVCASQQETSTRRHVFVLIHSRSHTYSRINITNDPPPLID